MRIISSNNNLDRLVDIAADYHLEQATQKKDKIKEFIQVISFLRQLFEIDKVIKNNHSILFQHRATGLKIICHYPPKLIPYKQLLQILDLLTSDEAQRQSSNKGVFS